MSALFLSHIYRGIYMDRLKMLSLTMLQFYQSSSCYILIVLLKHNAYDKDKAAESTTNSIDSNQTAFSRLHCSPIFISIR